jgi:CRISPR-associated protein Csx10
VTLSRRQTDDDTLSALIRTTRTDGWHQSWGQPRPSYIGLAAGSCIVFECQEGNLDKNKLQALMQRGLGERRAEGFGEVRFNPSLLSQETASLHLGMEPEPAERFSRALVGDGGDEFVTILETAAWREDIRRAAVALSAETKIRHQTFGWNSEKPPNSQLGALRAVLTRMQTAADKQIVHDWFAHLQKTDNRKDKWTDKALKFIESLFNDPKLIWQLAESYLTEGFPILHASHKATLEDALWAEAVRTLFAVAIHYEQRERE